LISKPKARTINHAPAPGPMLPAACGPDKEGMTVSYARRRAFLALDEQARLEKGNNTVVRVCMIGFGVAIAATVPVTWPWKIALFLVIMAFVGIVMPTIARARRNRY
jgi:hypothetical protein